MERYQSGEAEVVKNDDGKLVFRIGDRGCRDGEWDEQSIGFIPSAFPVGTLITINEPVPKEARSRQQRTTNKRSRATPKRRSRRVR